MSDQIPSAPSLERAVEHVRSAMEAALKRTLADLGKQTTTDEEFEAMISADIDVILKRLDDGMPRLFDDMKNIQASLRRPLAF